MSNHKFDINKLHNSIKRKCRKKGYEVNSKLIKEVWKEYVDIKIKEPLSTYAETFVEGMGNFKVVATPTLEHKMSKAMIEKGMMLKRGNLLKANRNLSTLKYVYKIIFEPTNRKHDKKVFFNADKNIRSKVNENIIKGKIITRF